MKHEVTGFDWKWSCRRALDSLQTICWLMMGYGAWKWMTTQDGYYESIIVFVDMVGIAAINHIRANVLPDPTAAEQDEARKEKRILCNLTPLHKEILLSRGEKFGNGSSSGGNVLLDLDGGGNGVSAPGCITSIEQLVASGMFSMFTRTNTKGKLSPYWVRTFEGREWREKLERLKDA